MKEVVGDLWDYMKPKHMLCITTNGTIKANGECVMGQGCAAQAKRRFPELPLELGKAIRANGNIVQTIWTVLLAFPVKHNWYEHADLDLIKRSTQQLMVLALQSPEKTFVLPRPGCGNGKRYWQTDVKPIVGVLPDNVLVISRPGEL